MGMDLLWSIGAITNIDNRGSLNNYKDYKNGSCKDYCDYNRGSSIKDYIGVDVSRNNRGSFKDFQDYICGVLRTARIIIVDILKPFARAGILRTIKKYNVRFFREYLFYNQGARLTTIRAVIFDIFKTTKAFQNYSKYNRA